MAAPRAAVVSDRRPLKNDELRHRGKTYPMTQHGFARDQRFDWVERELDVLHAGPDATAPRRARVIRSRFGWRSPTSCKAPIWT